MKSIKSIFKKIFKNVFKKKKHVKLGLYGPPNGGKTTLANQICQDWLGENMGKASSMAHETREIHIKEEIHMKRDGKELTFNLVDTPGIATKIDYEDFMKKGMKKEEAKKRAKEATKDIPVLIVANKIDLKKANIKKLEAAFPQYNIAGISAKYGKYMDEFYDAVFDLV